MRLRLLVAAVALGLGLSACGDHSREDARDAHRVDKTPPEVIAFNNRYPNIEDKCDGHGHRVYVTSTKRVLVIADPSCKGYGEGTASGAAVSAGP